MTPGHASAPLPLAGRAARIRARAGAFLADSLLVAYAAWCLDFLSVRLGGGGGRSGWLGAAEGVLGHRPWLVLLAPLVAVLWETTGESLGQLAWRVQLEGPQGQPTDRDRRALRGLFAGLQVALALVPAALGLHRAQGGGDPGFHFVLSLLMVLAFLAAGLADPRGRGLVDLLAGTCTGLRPARQALALRPWWRRLNPWIVGLVLTLTFLVGAVLTEFDPREIATGVGRTQNLWERLFHPDWSIAGRVIERLVETVFLALMASVLALPFAFALSFLGARNVTGDSATGGMLYVVARVLMNIVRSIEPLVWAIIFVLWVGVGPFAGMLALFVHSVAALGKLYSEAVESIDPGPVEAIAATGADRLQILRYGVVPQVVPPFLSFTIYRWDINVRMATILGLVGGGGIGDLLINYQQLGAWSKVGTIIVFITLVVWLMDWASSKARERLL